MSDDEIYAARLDLVDFAIEAFWDVPEASFVEGLLDEGAQFPEESINDHLDEGFALLRSWIAENRGRSVEAVRDDLEREYTDLFVGPRPPVLPHETYFRDDTDFIGEGLADVEASYAGAGWAPPEDYPEENDFVAVELAFLRHLVDRQRAGVEEAVGFERVFLDEHLLRWHDELAADVREKRESEFYLAAALVHAGLVEFEDELIAQQVPGSG